MKALGMIYFKIGNIEMTEIRLSDHEQLTRKGQVMRNLAFRA